MLTMIVKILILLALALLGWSLWRWWLMGQRQAFIAAQPLPSNLRAQLRLQQPAWGPDQLAAVEQGLRQFFRVCARSPGQFIAMPSKAVDSAWHAFILDTRAYQHYCQRAFGRMLHHTPAAALPSAKAPIRLRQGLRRCWIGACDDEGLNPKNTTRLPLLFALDAELGIAGGYRYVPDCRQLGKDRGDTHCATDLSDDMAGSSGPGDGDGRGDGGNEGGSDGGSDGGGCGGGD